MTPARARRWLAAVVCASALIGGWQIGWGLPSDYGWAPDELVPSAVLTAAARRFSGGWYEKYPPLHYELLALWYAPVAAAARLVAPSLTAAGLVHALFLAGRALSLLMAIAVVILVYRCSREVQDETASVLAAALAVFTPTFAYYAKVANLDVPYLFWFCLSLLFYLRALDQHRTRDYLLFAASAAAAVATKDQAYGLYVLTAPYLAWRLRGRRQEEGRDAGLAATLADRRTVGGAATFALLLLVLDNVLINPAGWIEHVRLATGPASRDFRVFAPGPRGELLVVAQALNHLRFVLGWPALVVCAVGLVSAARERPTRLLATLVPAVSYVVFFMGVALYVYDRFLLPVAIVLALFGGRCLSAFVGRWGRAGAAVAIAIVGYGAARAASVDVLMAADARYAAEAWLAKEAAGRLIAAAGPLEYLPRLDGLTWRRLGPSPRRLAEMRPDFVVLNADYAARADAGTGERALYDQIEGGAGGYTMAFAYRGRPRATLLGRDDWTAARRLPILTNLDKVDPEIRVYRRR